MMNRRGVSPVVAILLLILIILIAIGAGIAVYMYIISFTSSTTTNTGIGKSLMSVDVAYYDTGSKRFILFVKNIGSSIIQLDKAYVISPAGELKVGLYFEQIGLKIGITEEE